MNIKSESQVLKATFIGNLLEFYDFTLYGSFVAILSPLFFPSSDPMTSLLSGFGVFAIGFLTRPLGAILFGYIGDRQGRKKALMLSIALMAIPTLVIGCLPTYEQIGIAAPIILIIARLLQGLCAGGEYNGAGIFVIEHTQKGKRGFYGSILTSSGFLGALLASIIGAIFTQKGFPEWSWRIPFILGTLLASVGFYLRKNVEESPEFLAAKTLLKKPLLPLMEVLKKYFPSFLICFFIGANTCLVFYLVIIYVNSILTVEQIITPSSMMIINTLMWSVCSISLISMGKLSDKIGHEKLMTLCLSLIIILALPASYVFSLKNSYLIVPMQVLLIFINEGFTAPSNAYMASLFPPHYRYLGVSLGYTMGLSLIGETAPYMVGWLTKLTQNPYVLGFYIILGGIFGFLALIMGKKFRPVTFDGADFKGSLIQR